MRVSLTVVLCWLWCSLSQAASLPDVVDQLRAGVVAVGSAYPDRQPNRKRATLSYLGTGFAVGNGRQVVTNAHVIQVKLDTANKERLVIFVGRGAEARIYPVTVRRTDEDHDLALLELAGAELPPLPLAARDDVREGQQVAFTGYPLGVVLGLYPATHLGIVSAITPLARPMERARNLTAAQLRRLRKPYDVYQLDAIAYPGNSGSPVYQPDTGIVIGILNSVFVKESKESMLERPSGISYAIPVRHLRQLLSGEP